MKAMTSTKHEDAESCIRMYEKWKQKIRREKVDKIANVDDKVAKSNIAIVIKEKLHIIMDWAER